MMTKEEVVALMESARSEQDWNAKCDQVKKDFGGYPPFWFSEIVMSGLSKRVIASFGGDASIRVVTYSKDGLEVPLESWRGNDGDD